MSKLKPGRQKNWDVEASRQLYNVSGWGSGYFDINGKGHAVALPLRDPELPIDIRKLIDDASKRGLSLPLLIRFSDILSHRIATLRKSFHTAMARESFNGGYTCVYPIKVNQQRQVVEEIVSAGDEATMGLEAGSKPELHAVLAMQEGPGGVVVCNGHKDRAYIQLALKAGRLGNTMFLVVEKPSELKRILSIAREEGVEPNIGIRIKLATSGSGKWEDSGGDRSKFGLTPTEVVRAVEFLRNEDALDAFRLIHFHLGSQISHIRSVKEALREMGRYYVELRKLGCPIEFLDLGGGLGVDYDGSRSADGFSINYTEQEYADDAVTTLVQICSEADVPHPHLITESGRAITAHHAMLAVNVIETASVSGRMTGLGPSTASSTESSTQPSAEPHQLTDRMKACLQKFSGRNLHGNWEEAQFLREEGHRLFDLGLISLGQRSELEDVYWQAARRAERLMRGVHPPPAELKPLQTILADKYFCNFSVFQSLPDSWAIGQEFPVMPLHRLGEQPTRTGILQDITCDSDGQIASYIGTPENSHTLPLHAPRKGESYYLGIFLTGAYQEILGELHNLFGDPNVIHVALDEDGGYRYEQVIHGQNVERVLSFVAYHRASLLDRLDRQVKAAVKAGRMTPAQGQALRNLYDEGLRGLPYMEANASRNLKPRAGSIGPGGSAGSGSSIG